MNKKKIAFISPIGNGGPTELYKNLVTELNKYNTIECTHIQSIFGWFGAHFNNKYNIIISVVPFFWRPPHCKFMLNIHGLFRQDRGIFSAGALLNWLYPYNTLFADVILYPSNYLKEYCNFDHPYQKVIANFCDIEIETENKKNDLFKHNITLLTIANFQIQAKAHGIRILGEYLSKYASDKTIEWIIIGDGKYRETERVLIEEMNLEKNNIQINWEGFCERNTIKSFLQLSSIFIYATQYETFGIVVLEACANGLPIILNDYASFHAIFDESMIIKNESNFLLRLNQLIKDEECYENASKISIETAKKYEKSLVVGKWLKFITSV